MFGVGDATIVVARDCCVAPVVGAAVIGVGGAVVGGCMAPVDGAAVIGVGGAAVGVAAIGVAAFAAVGASAMGDCGAGISCY